MKILRNIKTGDEITVHDIDARDLVRAGEYESLGDAPGFKATKEAALKVSVTLDPEFKSALEDAKSALDAAKAAIEAKDARIAELEAELAAKTPTIEEMKAGELITYAQANGLDIGDLKPQVGKETILAAVKAAIAAKANG